MANASKSKEELVALRRVAPRPAAQREGAPGISRHSTRPLDASGMVAARPLPPLKPQIASVSQCVSAAEAASSLD